MAVLVTADTRLVVQRLQRQGLRQDGVVGTVAR